MLKGATLAAAPRQQQQCWTRPCNDSSQLREIEVSIGANKEKRASLLSTPAVTASARSRKIVACTILRLIQASVGTINPKKKLLAHVEQEITPKHAHVTDRNGRDCREKGQAWTIPEPSSLPEPSSYRRDKSGTERASGRQYRNRPPSGEHIRNRATITEQAAVGEAYPKPNSLRGDNSGTE